MATQPIRRWCVPEPGAMLRGKAGAAVNTVARGFLDTWHQRQSQCRGGVALIGALALCPQWAGATVSEASPPPATAAAIEELADIMVEAPGPRYVSPTRHAQIGRIWAPVLINRH